MRFYRTKTLVASALGLTAWLILSEIAVGKKLPAVELYSFEQTSMPPDAKTKQATLALVSNLGVTHGQQALEVTFSPNVENSSVEFAPAKPWDCSELGNCRLSFEATNPGDVTVNVYCTVKATHGGSQRRQVAIPPGSSATYYFELKGHGLTEDHGLRDDPPSLAGVGTKMSVQGIKQKVHYEKVRAIEFNLRRQLTEKKLILDNIRLASNPPIDENYLVGLVDKFGQSTKVDFPLKVRSEAQLKQAADEELKQLAASGPLPDRSKFGGWKDGPKLKATGFFRTEKVGGKWALVDPEGYLHFASGIANNRMANTSTFTGVDFRDDSVRYKDPEDVTPEDSIGITPSSDAARKTRYIASEQRHKMFTWLPEYSDPLAKYYGYRRSAHRGPMPHGEVFSFYLANLERRYGSTVPGEAEAKWVDVTVDRMRDWGFTCMGNWTDPAFYHKNRIPYFANGWIIGKFKTLSAGYWGAMPDPFDPEFVRRAKHTTKVVGKEVQNNPWCVGVFVDNEKSWGKPGTVKQQYPIVLDALRRDAKDCPTKAAYMKILREKYSTIESLNAAWETQLASWDELAAGVEHEHLKHGEELIADYSMLLEAYATEYFRVVHDALEEVLPNQLYLGPRFASWGLTPEVIRASKKYCDVIGYNFYEEGLVPYFWKFLAEVDMPSMIGEFHMGAADTGYFNPGLIHAADQKERARMWKTYMESVVDNPYFVGAHWFQYLDSPLTGRAHDGENYNVGFVTVADIPYPHMVKAAKKFHSELYQRRYGHVSSLK